VDILVRELRLDLRRRNTLWVLSDELGDLGHEAVGSIVPRAHAPFGEHPLHQRVTISLGEFREFLAAQSPPYRLQIIAVTLQCDSPDSAPTGEPFVARLAQGDLQAPHVAAFGDFRCDSAIFASRLCKSAISEPLAVAATVGFVPTSTMK
jgi:hypothetical protein